MVTNEAPASPSPLAMEKPIPCVPPVINALLPDRLNEDNDILFTKIMQDFVGYKGIICDKEEVEEF